MSGHRGIEFGGHGGLHRDQARRLMGRAEWVTTSRMRYFMWVDSGDWTVFVGLQKVEENISIQAGI